MGNNGVVQPYLRGLCVCFVAVWIMQCDASRTRVEKHFTSSNTRPSRKTHFLNKKLDINVQLDSSSNGPYVSPSFSMAPYDSLPPTPTSQPENGTPYCVYPPPSPQPPSIIPTPMGSSPPPPQPMFPGPTLIPPSSSTPTQPVISPPSSDPMLPGPNPPTDVPTPTQPAISPPTSDPMLPSPNPPTDVPTPTQPVIGPPISEPSPPHNIPSPSGSVPSPRFLPPVVYPPPMVPPPPNRAPSTTLWCVAKASVPEPIIQEAMNYACGSGADCDGIQPNGPCFRPNTLFAHASYAFNSYWQRTKLTAGGTCDFGGTAVLVTVDPSYDGCHFVYF